MNIEAGETTYEEYSLDGGESYREILFTLPEIDSLYRTDHWGEENIFAHTRLQDFRTSDERSNVLFVEEIQSDWHQDGREKGYGVTKEQVGEVKVYPYREFRKGAFIANASVIRVLWY